MNIDKLIALQKIQEEKIKAAYEQARRQLIDVSERIIGKNHLMDVYYLNRGMEVAKTVCRIMLKKFTGELTPLGTGFLVSPQLLMTNNHIISDPEYASCCYTEFEYQTIDRQGNLGQSVFFSLAPEKLFITSRDLDYTLVAVSPQSIDGKKMLATYGWNQLTKNDRPVSKGERVTIIQHPNGKPKQIALRDNEVVNIASPYIFYKTDTDSGSSGSLVVNDQWEVVALHRAYKPQINNLEKETWAANQGVLISLIIEDIQRQRGGQEQSELIDELLARVEEEDSGYKVPGADET